MNARSAKKPTVAILGTGRVGTAMACLLSQREYDVVAVADKAADAADNAAALSGARAFENVAEAAALAQVILITTADGSIEEVCRSIAFSGQPLEGRKVIHMSGALSLQALASAADKGADTLSIHPIQTFADLQGATEALPGSTFGVTCDPQLEGWARAFAASLDGRVLIVRDEDKVLYHAAAAIACNLLAMVQYGAQFACRELGFADTETSEAFGPLVVATAMNVARIGPSDALTGPLSRGDVATIRAHLQVLQQLDGDLAEMYRAVSRWGLKLVAEKGDLEATTIETMRRLLD